jgi:hypothetical protein
MTITEALAEIKTLEKRRATKVESVLTYLCQHEAIVDPLVKEGGSEEFIKRERQAIDDLETRIVDIRAGVARVNDKTTITILGKTRTLTEWLAWRKDVAPGVRLFLAQMRQKIAQQRAQLQSMIRSNQAGALNVNTQSGESKPYNLRVYLDEQKLAKESENFEETFGQLDGQLSLKNATTQIELK